MVAQPRVHSVYGLWYYTNTCTAWQSLNHTLHKLRTTRRARCVRLRDRFVLRSYSSYCPFGIRTNLLFVLCLFYCCKSVRTEAKRWSLSHFCQLHSKTVERETNVNTYRRRLRHFRMRELARNRDTASAHANTLFSAHSLTDGVLSCQLGFLHFPVSIKT